MSSLNKVMLIGRLGRDPEVRFTPGGSAVANFSMATTEKWTKDGKKQEKTEWHKIVIWGKLAEVVEKYVHKGDQIYIEGKLQTRKWEDKEGGTRYTTEIVAHSMVMLGSGKGNSGGGHEPGEAIDDSDIPF